MRLAERLGAAISVTAEHIAAARITSDRILVCDECPIALALFEAGFTRVHAYYGALAVGDGRETIWLRPSPEMSAFMREFDHSKPVQPFTFRLADLSPRPS